MTIRKAKKEDVIDVVRMLADDKLGNQREDFNEPLPDKYYFAFENIQNDPNQDLMILENETEGIVGTLQLSFIQYLTYQGGIRSQIEAVRIRKDQRGKGIGKQLFEWAIERSKERGAHLIQLTTDKKRPKALNFYKKLGFKASHEGMKLHLQNLNK
ncbi:MAG: GNAT family N-acetyltransferase [Bacteroidota bacterium]